MRVNPPGVPYRTRICCRYMGKFKPWNSAAISERTPAIYEIEVAAARPTVLVVDDTPENLAVTGEWLRPNCLVKAVKSGWMSSRVKISRSRPG